MQLTDETYERLTCFVLDKFNLFMGIYVAMYSATESSACRCKFGSESWLKSFIGYQSHTASFRYKLCLMMLVAVNNRSPLYITDTLVPTSSLLHRERLRMHESGGFKVARVQAEFGRRAFSIASPTLHTATVWNELPNNVRSEY